MKQEKKARTMHLMQDIGILGFLICVFCIVCLEYMAQGTDKIECLFMFLISCIPCLFCVYKMPVIAFTCTGVELIGYTAYKLYRWSIWEEPISVISYAWIVLPFAAVISLRLFMYGNMLLEQRKDMLERQVEELVVVDPLTGLYNRRFLYHELTHQIARSGRSGDKIVLMAISLKYEQELKRILSVRQFERLRQKMAEVMESRLRMEDELYVLNQDGMFAAVLVNCNKDGAAVVEERLRAALLEKNVFAGIVDGTVKVEVKIGYVEYEQEKIKNAMEFLVQAENELQYDV